MRNISEDFPSLFNNKVMNEHLYDNNISENHKYFLIKLVFEIYIKTKLHFIGKCISLENVKDFVRNILTKTILFMGQ